LTKRRLTGSTERLEEAVMGTSIGGCWVGDGVEALGFGEDTLYLEGRRDGFNYVSYDFTTIDQP
jgi:hypothetical protein